jgi:esterase/lipase superfamily enzyme
MISNRDLRNGSPGSERGPLSYYVADDNPTKSFSNWKPLDFQTFKTKLVDAANQFPSLAHGDHEQQSHVALFVHGFNVDYQSAVNRYQQLCASLFHGEQSLGLCICFDWPSFGSVVDYYPDRGHARECAEDLAFVLCELFDWLITKQRIAVSEPLMACKAKVSIIAHSMGNYLLQKSLSSAWTRKNRPALVSLINQLVMVAADVDSDLFEPSSSDGLDGDAIANLTYRITALYSGRDAALGASAGLKHFGTRRLGRSGLAHDPPTKKDNIWQVDCSSFFPDAIGGVNIHSAYFDVDGTIALIRGILQGVDRTVLDARKLTKGTEWP